MSFDKVVAYFIVEALLNGAFISSSRIFLSKGHGRVAVCPKWSNARGFNLVVLF